MILPHSHTGADVSHFLTADPSNALTHRVIGAAITVHRKLGPGLFESVYEACLAAELRHDGLAVEEQLGVPLVYREVHLDCGFRMDLLVEKELVVELKAVDQLGPVHRSQILTYLRLTGLRAGLILNFNTPYLADGGIRRVLLDR